LCTPHVGDIPEIVKLLDIGCVIDSLASAPLEDLSAWFNRLTKERVNFGYRCSDAAQKYFGSGQVSRLREMIDSLMDNQTS
jgi:hypothetical protein